MFFSVLAQLFSKKTSVVIALASSAASVEASSSSCENFDIF